MQIDWEDGMAGKGKGTRRNGKYKDTVASRGSKEEGLGRQPEILRHSQQTCMDSNNKNSIKLLTNVKKKEPEAWA